MQVFVLLFACVTCLAVCRADELAAVTGLVTDPNGRSVPGVTILITNLSTDVASRTVTNDQGIYYLPSLQPGIYRMTIDKDGFKSIVKNGIELHVQDVASINFELQLGSVNETVTVEAGGLVIDTTDASVSTVIDHNLAQSLPLNGRSFNTLLQLTPGVVIAQAPQVGGPSLPGQFSIAGQRTDANSFSVDGVSANFGVASSTVAGNSGTGSAQAFSVFGGTSSLVSVDALQEFRIETSSFAPEFGRSPGGQVILTTRSGTNDFHGGLFDYFRNTVLDANDWFANAAGLSRSPEHHNDFGGFLGGPLWKDHTFFFFSYEGARLVLPGTADIQVPSEYARSTAPAQLAPYLNAFPQPNDQTIIPGVYTAAFIGPYSNRGTLNAASLRVDQKLSDRFFVFGRYNYAPSSTTSRNASIPNNPETVTGNTQTLTVGANMLFSRLISNTLRGNYSTQSSGSTWAMDSLGGAVPINPSFVLGSFPVSNNLGNFEDFDTNSFYLGKEARNSTAQINFVDDLALTLGAHQLKFGGDYRAIFFDANPYQSGVFLFTSTIQEFVSPGTAGSASISTTSAVAAKILAQSLGLYAQDMWKVTPRLTITYGLRWELAPAPSGRSSTILSSWTNTSNPAEIGLAPTGTPVWRTTYTNFAPRLGLAYSVTPQGDFVVRAGVGFFYDTTAGEVGSLATSFPNSAFGPPAGVSPTVTLPANDFTPYLSAISLQPPFPSVVDGFADNLRAPRSYQWNVALEKSLGGTQVISATYVGQAGRDLLRQEGLPQPNASFSGDLLLTVNTARSNYNALQLQYRRPLSARLQALLGYTWSHSLDNASNDALVAVSHTIISAANDYANSDFDVRHSFSGAVAYSIPSLGRSGLVSTLTRDWSLDAVIVARSGFQFNPVLLFGGPAGASLSRPNLVPGQPIWLYGSQCIAVDGPPCAGGKGLNPAAFTIPATGQQGTEPRNDIPGFGLTEVDLSVARKFAINERLNLQFQADAFNVLNHPNFTNPVGLVQFGILMTSTRMLNQGLGGLNPLFQEGGPRSLQLSLKLTF